VCIVCAGQEVLNIRANFPPRSLAELCNPLGMAPELLKSPHIIWAEWLTKPSAQLRDLPLTKKDKQSSSSLSLGQPGLRRDGPVDHLFAHSRRARCRDNYAKSKVMLG
jgi:hypothetical protein